MIATARSSGRTRAGHWPAPLDRIMAEADSRRVLAETRLADETLFPITLPVSEDGRELPEESAALARELLEKSGLLSVGAALWGR